MFRSGGFSYSGQTFNNPTFTGTVTATGATINNGTYNAPSFTGNQVGSTYPLATGGIPLIALSSGSVAANGAISGITALPAVYPQAYCYFPANALATVSSAGWYYCTFSTTTAGVAFLDTYTSGVPAAPGSPTAVSDGKGAFTGATTELMGYTVTVPANALGANGEVRFHVGVVMTANANSKIARVRWSTSAGTVFTAVETANLTHGGFTGAIVNTGATNKNVSRLSGSLTTVTVNSIIGTIDTTASTTLVVSLQRATATDNFIMLPSVIEVSRVS